jgi:hypothetical protein
MAKKQKEKRGKICLAVRKGVKYIRTDGLVNNIVPTYRGSYRGISMNSGGRKYILNYGNEGKKYY